MCPLLGSAQGIQDSIDMLANASDTTMLGTYYADRFVGRKTSCGEIFRQNQYTAAHKTLPMGTYLLVTYPVTNQHVVVRVNDRCPKTGILDMTKLAVHTLGIRGSGRVKVTILDPRMGSFLWSNQDTLAMTEAEYMAFRDKSRIRRISPWPINSQGSTPTLAQQSRPKRGAEPPPKGKQQKEVQRNTQTSSAKDTVLANKQDTVVTEPPAKGHLYDIELCTVGSQQAANNEAKRLPQDLQNKVVFDRNFQNRQVRIILVIAESRSHAVRTQAMLIDDFPDSYVIPHE